MSKRCALALAAYSNGLGARSASSGEGGVVEPLRPDKLVSALTSSTYGADKPCHHKPGSLFAFRLDGR